MGKPRDANDAYAAMISAFARGDYIMAGFLARVLLHAGEIRPGELRREQWVVVMAIHGTREDSQPKQTA